MSASKPLYLMIAAAVAAATASPWPANGQCRLCAKPGTGFDAPENDDDISIQIDTSLSFDRLVLYGSGPGSALIRPDGSSSAQGTVADVGPRAMVGSARVHGQPGRTVRVDLPRQVVLYSLSGGQITVQDLSSDLPALPRLDGAGNLSFRFGGQVQVTGDASGDYRGNLPITVEYQ